MRVALWVEKMLKGCLVYVALQQTGLQLMCKIRVQMLISVNYSLNG